MYGSRGSKFYYPFNVTRVIDFDQTIFFEDINDDRIFTSHDIIFREECVVILVKITPPLVVMLPLTKATNIVVQDPIANTIIDVNVVNDATVLRRSQRIHRLAILDYYIIYLQEHECNIVVS